VVGALVAAYELAPPHARPRLADRARLLLPALLGAVTLIPFLRGGTGHVAVGIYHTIRLRNLLRFPPLSMLSPPDVAFLPEFGGQYLPLTLLLPALAGAALSWREPRRGTRALAAVALFSMLLTLDALELPSRMLRAFSLGSGIRVFSRFYPFSFFVSPWRPRARTPLAGQARAAVIGRADARGSRASWPSTRRPACHRRSCAGCRCLRGSSSTRAASCWWCRGATTAACRTPGR
jgi:hypothetical protein